MSTATVELEIRHEAGLASRNASFLAKIAYAYEATIQIRNVSRDTPFVNAMDLLDVLVLAVAQGHVVELKAEGEDAAAAIEALQELIDSNFGEPPEA